MNIAKESWSPCRHSNAVPSKHEAGLLTTEM